MGFATQFVVDQVDPALAVWEPSGNVVTVHRTEQGWTADWPDEEHPPLPEPTVGWLLWHIEFWWFNAADAADKLPTRAPQHTTWSGSTAGLVAAHARWRAILERHDLDELVVGLMPEPRPFWFIAMWVNFELTKNLAEINQLKIRHANQARGPLAWMPSDRPAVNREDSS